jgi:hypothetical protein
MSNYEAQRTKSDITWLSVQIMFQALGREWKTNVGHSFIFYRKSAFMGVTRIQDKHTLGREAVV